LTGEDGTRIADVIDAIRPTLMIVEAAVPVPWTQPEDVPCYEAKQLPKLGGQFLDGAFPQNVNENASGQIGRPRLLLIL
jgi:hypothetical protein